MHKWMQIHYESSTIVWLGSMSSMLVVFISEHTVACFTKLDKFFTLFYFM